MANLDFTPRIPFLDKLLSIGIPKDDIGFSKIDTRKVRLSNMIAIVGIFFSPFYIYLTLFSGMRSVDYTDLISIIVLAVPILANLMKKYVLARYWICIVYPLLIIQIILEIGSDMEVDLILIAIAAMPIVLFDRPSRYIPLILYVIGVWFFCNFVVPEFEPILYIYEPSIIYLNEVIVFVATLILIWQFKYQTAQASQQVFNSNLKLQEQIKIANNSEQRFRTMAENIPNGSVTIIGKDYTVLDAAGQQVKYYQKLVDQQIGKDIREVLGLDGYKERKEYYDKAFAGETAVFESEYLNEYYINSVSPIMESGEINSIIVSSQKITEFKLAQEELNRQKQLTENIFNNAPLLISVLGEDGKYITVNRKYEEQFNLPVSEIIGKHYSEILRTNVKEFEIIGENLKKTIKEGRYSYTYNLVSPITGERVSLLTIYTRLQYNNSPAVMIMAMNITAQKEAEEKLKASNKLLNEKNSMISDSINYALRIQNGVLDSSKTYLGHSDNSFVYFKPKDILSGDFYWAATVEGNKKLIIAADATGHGVPGAMLTLIGTDYLNEIIYSYQIHKPDIILQELDRKITTMLSSDGNLKIEDGMDMAIVLIDEENCQLEYSSAKSPIYLIDSNNGSVTRYSGNKFSIGGQRNKFLKQFTSEKIPYKDGDIIYMGSDGYSDQFGGEHRKKLGKKRMMSLMSTIWKQEMENQKSSVENYFMAWKGEEEQLDDVLFMGVKLCGTQEK